MSGADPNPIALASRIIAYENGELDEEETIDLFQDLVSTGVINHLQGHYGRTAQSLIDGGLLELPCTA